jgi:dTDP-4-dehydrorhamnose reductase
MKVLITGSNGQLGTDLCQALKGFDVIPLTHVDLDITDMPSVKRVFRQNNPDVIINTAAYVRVDDCEDNPDTAYLVNALGARNMAVLAQEVGAKLVHISSDYVFGGDNSIVRVPFTEFDKPAPINVYGKSKLAGEDFVRHLCHKHFIIRGSGLFGVAGSSGKGGNFVETMIRLAKERPELRVVNDQIFSPTYTKDLANKIVELISTEYYGVFHITNSGACSWNEFASEIVRLAGIKTPVLPISSAQYPQKAKRPQYSVLSNYHLKLLGINGLRTWQEALKDYLTPKSK